MFGSSIINIVKEKNKYRRYKKQKNIFDSTNTFEGDNHLYNTKWGKYSACTSNCRIIDTEVGNFVSIGWNTSISPRNHIYSNFTNHKFVYLNKENYVTKGIYGDYLTKIGHDVWIGCNTVVMHGVEIGNGAIIAAGSIVTKSVPPYAVIGGNPAKFMRWRFNQQQINKLMELNWYEWETEEIFERSKELEKIVGFDIDEFFCRYFVKKETIKIPK